MSGHEGWLIDGLITTLREMSPTTALASLLGVLALCGLGLPVPEDIVLITAGFLAGIGKFPLWVGVLAGMFGVLSGDAVLFFVGRRYGEDAFELPFVRRLVSRELLDAARQRVLRNARFVCFVARFLPGLRSPIYLMAGAMGIPPRTYLTQDGLAAALSVPIWVTTGWYFSDEIERAMLFARDSQRLILALLVVFIIVYVVVARRRRAPEEVPP